MPLTKNSGTFVGLPRREAVFYSILGLLILILYPLLWPEAPFTSGDSRSYFRVAEDLSDFRLDGLYVRSPGYPLLLLLTGSTTGPTRLLFYASLLLHLLTLWIIGTILHHLRFPPWCLILFAITMSLPPFVESASMVLSEILAEFMIVLSFGLLVVWLNRRHTGWLIAAGLSLGWAALVRPTFQLVFIPVALTFLSLSALAPQYMARREAIRSGILVLVTSGALVASYASYNYWKHNYPAISPGMLAMCLSTRTVTVLERLPDRFATEREILIAARDRDLIERGTSHQGDQFYFAKNTVQDLRKATGMKGAQFERRMVRMFLGLILQAPMTYVMEVLHSCTTFWLPWTNQLSRTGSPLLLLFWAFFQGGWVVFFLIQLVALTGASLLALLRWTRSSRIDFNFKRLAMDEQHLAIYLLGLAIILYTMLISCLLNIGDARYRAPVDPILLCLCFVGAGICWRLSTPETSVQSNALPGPEKASQIH